MKAIRPRRDREYWDKYWEQQLLKGKLRFIVTHGMLRWGLPTGVLFFFFQNLFYELLPPKEPQWGWSIEAFLITVLLFAIVGGGFMGWMMWSANAWEIPVIKNEQVEKAENSETTPEG